MSVVNKMKKKTTIALLSTPLIISVIWLIVIVSSSQTFTLAGGAHLAPVSDKEPLIIGLSVFILGYLLFIFLMFSEDIKEMFSKKAKVEKKSKKKKK